MFFSFIVFLIKIFIFLIKIILFLILFWVLYLFYTYSYKNKYKVYFSSFLLSLVIFYYQIFYVLFFFNKKNVLVGNLTNFFYYEELDCFSFGTYSLVFDNLSVFFCVLTSFIISSCVLYTKDYVLDKNYNFYLICFFLIEYFLLNVFLTFDIFFFFVYFESAVIPMFLIILFWGARSRRIKASFYLLMYAMLSSVFFILAIVIIWSNVGSLNMLILKYFY